MPSHKLMRSSVVFHEFTHALHWADLAARLSDWRRLLRSRPTHGQRVLRTLLDGPILVGTPTAQGVPWEARGSLRGLLGTVYGQVASPTGFEPVFQP